MAESFIVNSAGSKGELQESEVHTLSPTQRSAALYAKFKATPARSLLFRCLSGFL